MTRSRTRTKKRIAILAGLALIGFAPILIMLASSAIAGALGCRVDEGRQHPCQLGAVEIGGALHVGFVSAWFLFLTLPAMLVGFAAWIVAAAGRFGCRLIGRDRQA